MNEQRIAAFVEYVLRPLSEDWRLIIEQIAKLDLPLTPGLIQRTAMALGVWHTCGELIRAASAIAITWIICQTVTTLWPLL